MKTTHLVLIVGASALGAGSALGQSTPIQLSLVPDVALYPRTTLVEGFSLGIWSENPQHSLTIGLINGSTGDSEGFSWGIANYAESYHGVQFGWLNFSQNEFVGWQHGWVNVDLGTFTGLQDAAINVVNQDATGLQLGVVNYAEHLHGIQLGLINVAMNNPWFTECPDKLATGFPILNWSF